MTAPPMADLNRVKTHCPNGHPYTPDNTRIERDRKDRPHRRCRACDADRYRRRYAAAKQRREAT